MILTDIIYGSIFVIFICILPIGAILFIGILTDTPIPEPQQDHLITYTQAQMDIMNACYKLLDDIDKDKQECDRVIKACDEWLLKLEASKRNRE